VIFLQILGEGRDSDVRQCFPQGTRPSHSQHLMQTVNTGAEAYEIRLTTDGVPVQFAFLCGLCVSLRVSASFMCLVKVSHSHDAEKRRDRTETAEKMRKRD